MAAEFERIAMDLFVKRGYADVSVDDIADAAGVSARTFYRYFTAKEDVLALYPRRLTEFVRQVNLPGMIDLTPGIRSLHLHYDSRILSLQALLEFLIGLLQTAGAPATERASVR